jgi:hypothetical protein
MTQPPKAFLVATAKNEAPYFLEWVAYHLEIGFTDIAIYQNDSDDLTHETLASLREIGAIQYFYNRADVGAHQVRAYTRAATLPAYKEADWAMALDMDEFLVIKTGDGTITDLLKVLPESDCLHLNWRIFGNSGYEVMTDELVTDRFKMANYQLGDADNFGAFKCMFRPHLFNRPGIHQPNAALVPIEELRHTNGSGLASDAYFLKNFNSTDPGGCQFAQVNHYIVRDLCSFMLKSARGSAHQANRTIGHRYWRMRNKNFAIDDSMQGFQTRIKARMAALDEASGGRLMKLRETAIFTHLARYYTMLQEPQMRAFRAFCLAHPNAVDYTKIARDPSDVTDDVPLADKLRPAKAKSTASKAAVSAQVAPYDAART